MDAVSDNLCARMLDDPLAWCEELLANDAPLTLPDVAPVPHVESTAAVSSPCSSESPDVKDASDRRLSYRQRQRHEIIALRETVAKMEAELERLRDVRCGSRQGRAESSEETTSEQRLMLAVEDFWRRAATRERLGRQRAVQEQERLRHLVEQNIKVVKTLERLLEQQIQTEMAGQAITRSLYLERLGLLQEGLHTRHLRILESRSRAKRTDDLRCALSSGDGAASRDVRAHEDSLWSLSR
ncbi:hypothetical protein PINS_up021606 [Pythium insidiosum]|nr:hypothetical protein PINS_up021606 [Pythium insidiosum]